MQPKLCAYSGTRRNAPLQASREPIEGESGQNNFLRFVLTIRPSSALMGLKAVSFFVNRHGSMAVVVEKRGAPLRAGIEEAKQILAGLSADLISRPACEAMIHSVRAPWIARCLSAPI